MIKAMLRILWKVPAQGRNTEVPLVICNIVCYGESCLSWESYLCLVGGILLWWWNLVLKGRNHFLDVFSFRLSTI